MLGIDCNKMSKLKNRKLKKSETISKPISRKLTGNFRKENRKYHTIESHIFKKKI